MNFWHDLTWVLPLRSPALTQLAFGLSWLGYTTFIMFFMALGYWAWSKATFYRLLILAAFAQPAKGFTGRSWRHALLHSGRE